MYGARGPSFRIVRIHVAVADASVRDMKSAVFERCSSTAGSCRAFPIIIYMRVCRLYYVDDDVIKFSWYNIIRVVYSYYILCFGTYMCVCIYVNFSKIFVWICDNLLYIYHGDLITLSRFYALCYNVDLFSDASEIMQSLRNSSQKAKSKRSFK